MSKPYDLTDWDRLEYVQLAHEECGAALQHVTDAAQQVADGNAARSLTLAQESLTSLRERLALRVSDLVAQEEPEEPTWVHALDGTACESGPERPEEIFCKDHDRRITKEG